MQKPSFSRPSHTKIVATLGPATWNLMTLGHLLRAGVDVFRINAAHGNTEQFAATLALVRQACTETGMPAGVLMDLGGPKIRLGTLVDDELTVKLGDTVRFVPGTVSPCRTDLTCTYEPLVHELEVGDRVMLADGTVELAVRAKAENGLDWASCEVTEGGTVRSRQGVNLPGVKLSIPAMLDVDRKNAAWAARNGIDFLGLSFVRHAGEIEDLRNIIKENDGITQIVAKIEKPEAVENLESIVQATDAVMVARGDLGVETDIAYVPMLQKDIIRMCHKYCKPVIVATQMLESMTHNNFPTRAEVADVANAILDGADACMLSGETAVGDFPVATVNMMHRVALGTESSPGRCMTNGVPHTDVVPSADPITAASARNACELAKDVGAKCIIVVTNSGTTARCLSQNRPSVAILGLTHQPETQRRMCLYWGVVPVLVPEKILEPEDIFDFIIEKLTDRHLVHPGDRLVLLAGTKTTDQHNAILVREV